VAWPSSGTAAALTNQLEMAVVWFRIPEGVKEKLLTKASPQCFRRRCYEVEFTGVSKAGQISLSNVENAVSAVHRLQRALCWREDFVLLLRPAVMNDHF
jgi:hypothetical protein